MDSAPAMAPWARMALHAALAAKASKPAKSVKAVKAATPRKAQGKPRSLKPIPSAKPPTTNRE